MKETTVGAAGRKLLKADMKIQNAKLAMKCFNTFKSCKIRV